MSFSNLAMNRGRFHGLTSEIMDFASVRGTFPANLFHHLIFFGASLGRSPYVEHRGEVYASINGLLIMDTAGGKGESLGIISEIYDFDEEHRDLLPITLKASLTGGNKTLRTINNLLKKHDNGENRLLSVDCECSSQFACQAIPTNGISQLIIRLADGEEITDTIGNKTFQLPPVHFGSVGHITPAVLLKKLKTIEMMNGFANRFLFIGVPRPTYSYDDGSYSKDELVKIQQRLMESLDKGSNRGKINIDDEAKDYYLSFVRSIRDDMGKNDKIDALQSRFDKLCLKVALTVALTNQEETISLASMEAASEVIRYSSETLKELYGDSIQETPEVMAIKFVEQRGEIARTELMVELSKKLERSIADKVVDKLVRSGRLKAETRVGSRGRRPVYYTINTHHDLAA